MDRRLTDQSRFHVRTQDKPVVDQGDAGNETWMKAGGDPRDRGRMVELVSEQLVGSQRLMVGLAWLSPGEVHLHHHPHADEWYYAIRGSARFTISDEVIRGTPGSALWIPTAVPHGIHNDDPQDTLEFLWGFDNRVWIRSASSGTNSKRGTGPAHPVSRLPHRVPGSNVRTATRRRSGWASLARNACTTPSGCSAAQPCRGLGTPPASSAHGKTSRVWLVRLPSRWLRLRSEVQVEHRLDLLGAGRSDVLKHVAHDVDQGDERVRP